MLNVEKLQEVKANAVALAGDVTDTTELSVALNRTINSIYLVAEDKKVTLTDIAFVIDDLGPWQKAIEGLDFYQEISNSSPEQIRQIVEAGRSELSAVPADQKEDILNFQAGLLSAYRLLTRKMKSA